ncbi:MAG: hypothetical protein ACYC2U_06870 [Candidatus Amoebophilus sp.]
MAFALKLLRINIYNSYYSNQVDNSFHLVADETTQQLMDYHRMRLNEYEGGYEIIWLTNKFDDPLQVFQDKIAGSHLNFYFILRNPYAINFSLLNPEQGYIYYFSNTNNSENLHKQAYVAEEDKVPFSTSIHSIGKPFPNAFGIIHIQLANLCNKKLSIEKLPVQYNIKIKARETIWRYHIIDVQEHIKSPMKVVIDEDDSYFIYKGTPENKHIHVYESKKPLTLSDKPSQKFSLKMISKKTTKKTANTEETLLERLPLPDTHLLENNVEKGGIFYSNIVVYV